MLEPWRTSLSRHSKRLAAIVLPGLLLVGCLGDQSVAAAARRLEARHRPAHQHRPARLGSGASTAADGLRRRIPRAQAPAPRSTRWWQRLAKAGEGQIGHYEITILNSPVVNAFALPNGRLYVTRGLLALANDTSEIASVLAHEIAHVTAQHAVERAEKEAESALVSQVVSQVLNDPARRAPPCGPARSSRSPASRASRN